MTIVNLIGAFVFTCVKSRFSHDAAHLKLRFDGSHSYRCNSFIVDLRHKFTVRSMNAIPVFV